MARKTKDETLDLFYFNSNEEQGEKKTSQRNRRKKKQTSQKQNRNHINKKSNHLKNKQLKQNQEENTKEEKFSFDEEIIIGLKRIDAEEGSKTKQKNKKEKKLEQSRQLKQNKSKGQAKSRKNRKQQNREELTDIPTIGVTDRQEEKSKNRQNQKKKNNQKKPEKKLTPQQELARKKRKVVFRITKWFMFLAIVVGAGIYALLSPIFNVKKIDISGNSKISNEEIESLSGIQLEQNMFRYRKEDISKQLKENAYIDSVHISRKIPDTVQITVSERTTSFLLQVANAYAYISSQGYILEISNQKLNLPVLTGFETEQENIQVGLRLCTEDLEKLGDVLKIMEAATSNKLAKDITRIDISDENNYVLTMQKQKKTIYLGDISNLSTKMLWILAFNEQEKNTQGDIILNMNLNDEKSKPYFREKI